MINIGWAIFNLILIPSCLATMDTILVFTIQLSAWGDCNMSQSIYDDSPATKAKCSDDHCCKRLQHIPSTTEQNRTEAIETEVNVPDILI